MDPTNAQNNFSYPAMGGSPADNNNPAPKDPPVDQAQLDNQVGSLTPTFGDDTQTPPANGGTAAPAAQKPTNLDDQLSSMDTVKDDDPAAVVTNPDTPPVVGLKEKVEAVEKEMNKDETTGEKVSPLQKLAQKLSGIGGGLVEEDGKAENKGKDAPVEDKVDESSPKVEKKVKEAKPEVELDKPTDEVKEDKVEEKEESPGSELSTDDKTEDTEPATEPTPNSSAGLAPATDLPEITFRKDEPAKEESSPEIESGISLDTENPDQSAVTDMKDNLGKPADSVANIEFDPASLNVHDERMDSPPAADAGMTDLDAPVSDGSNIKIDQSPTETVEEPSTEPETAAAEESTESTLPEPQNTVDSIDDILPATPPDEQAEEQSEETPAIETIPAVEPLMGPTVEELASEKPDVKSNARYPYTIEQLMDVVVEKEASDLHITVGYPAMIRIDGELVGITEEIVTEQNAVDLVLPVLPEQKKELLEVNREVDLAYSHREDARFRINAYYQQQTLAAAFRLIPNRIRNIDELNLPQIYHQISKLRQGLVLVTGPTGSGKSTTLAAIIQEANESRPDHIITIEDPVEYVFPKARAMVDQRELHEDTHSWEIALKSALRQDPDIMLVGEMRDYDTISSAITLAETGHLVFATLHTNSAAQTLDRIVDVFPEHQQGQVRSQLSNTIEAVIAQRLIPISRGGRRAVSEIMLATPAIRNLIREAKTHQIDNVIRTSADIGMISLEHSLVKLVRDNVITMEKAQEYAVHPEEITRLLKS